MSDEVIDEAAARRNSRVLVVIILGIGLLGGVVGVLIGITHHPSRHHHSGAGVGIGIGIAVGVVSVLGVVLLRMYRRPNYSRVMQFGWRRRNRVAKALRRGRPVAAEDMPVADALVRTMRKQRWVPYLFGVLPVIYLGNGLLQHGFQRWSALTIAVLYVILLPFILRQRRRTFANYDRLVGAGR